jgi:hypothetical protein
MLGRQVHDHVMKAHPAACVRFDRLEGEHRFSGPDDYPRLLQHLAFGGLAQGFAELNTPARNGPCACARRLSTFDQ